MDSKALVVVHGSYFAGNFGDTLLVSILCDAIAERIGFENVYLAVEGNQEEQESIGYPVLDKSRRKDVTHVVYAGGGYFGEPPVDLVHRWRWGLRNYFRHLAWLSSYNNASVGCFGLGIGPISFYPMRHAVKKLSIKSEFFLLRDQESADYSRIYGFDMARSSVVVDMALTLHSSLQVENCVRSGVCLHIDGLSEREISIVLNVLKIRLPGLKSVCVVFDSKAASNEQKKAKYIRANECQPEQLSIEFLDYTDFRLLQSKLSVSELVITNKLHVGIVAVSLGASVISIPTHSKTIRFYRQLGLDKFCISRSDFSAAKLQEVMESIEDFRPDWFVVQKGINALYRSIENFIFDKS